MPIEVKQLVIRGDIHSVNDSDVPNASPAVDVDALKDELLEACRKMMEELLEQRRER